MILTLQRDTLKKAKHSLDLAQGQKYGALSEDRGQ